MLLFARMPYCDTSLRDIAAAAEVDVAYVHRSFGSKAEIFRHALAALDPLDDIMVATDGRSMISGSVIWLSFAIRGYRKMYARYIC